ncbi:MAG: zeta toxin family protein [Clostridiales bacterium]|nr:zeta toxin family protein [Clostridiales bacterium]
MENIKVYTIFAGVNGAGKSTLYRANKSRQLGVRLNSDEIIREAGGDWKSVEAQIAAGRKILRLQDECLSQGVSFNQETTLSGNSIIKTVQRAKTLGYFIHLCYVGVNSSDIAKERVAKRILQGGHGVSEATIERRYETSAENFLKIYAFCDKVDVYDNSGKAPVLVAFKIENCLYRTDAVCPWADDLLKSIPLN